MVCYCSSSSSVFVTREIETCFVFASRNISSESRKLVKWHVEETISWLRDCASVSYDDCLVRTQPVAYGRPSPTIHCAL